MHHPSLRGGWDVDPDEFRAMGFTVGFPPNLYIPRTPAVVALSRQFETADAIFEGVDSGFTQVERQPVKTADHFVRCHVAPIPRGLTPDRLRDLVNERLFRGDAVTNVAIHPSGQYAHVDFERDRDAERFLELGDSWSIEGYPVRVRRSNMPSTGDLTLPPEHPASLIVWRLGGRSDEDLRREIGGVVDVERLWTNRTLDFALIELTDPALVDYAALKITAALGLPCRRCFATREQAPRNRRIPRREGRYALPLATLGELSVADILNLDVQITEPAEDIPSHEGKSLWVFNVTEGSPGDERVLEDVTKEAGRFGEMIESHLEIGWSDTEGIGPPIVLTFQSSTDADQAQKHLAGRRYKGAPLFTMRRNDKQKNIFN